MSCIQSPRPPKHVEPVHIFEDATGQRRAVAVILALLAIIAFFLFSGDFILRLHKLPSLADRSDTAAAMSRSPSISEGENQRALSRIAMTASARTDASAEPVGQYKRPDRLAGNSQAPVGKLALTFDGLPAGRDLQDLLALLRQYGIEATFFVDGRVLSRHGHILNQITADKHIVGMLSSAPEANLTSIVFGPTLINNATQLMIVHETGRRTLLVRARYDHVPLPQALGGDGADNTQESVGYIRVSAGIEVPLAAMDQQGFVAWLVGAAGAGGIEGAGGIDILRFDLKSGNASQLILALPTILAQLEADGFQFQPLREAHYLSPDEAMPVSGIDANSLDIAAFGFLGFMQFGLSTVFLWMMVIAMLRSTTFLALALGRGTRASFDKGFQPAVTIIVPAYNEENVIVRCIGSLLEQDYAGIAIVVVDDGSTDQTAKVVQQAFGTHPQVTLMVQENHGKWSASNYALSAVTTELFVIADADSLFLPDTVSWLVQQFKDERIGAVAGQVEVGNHENLLTDCQRIEYIVSQNVMRRAYETFEGILVVPGAVGAWRTEAVFKAHEFSGESITEDADLTVAVHRAGYLVRFQEQARSVTEAPATVRAFLRQRLRWTFGMLQVAWKHRAAISEGRAVGYISIVDSVVFGFVSSMISPLVDLLLALILLQWIVVLATGGEMAWTGLPALVLFSYLALTIIDVINTLAAFRFERRFDLKLLILVPFLRFGYRQLLYISTLRAIWQAISGRMAGWDKLERSGARLVGSIRGVPAAQLVPIRADTERGWSADTTADEASGHKV